MATINIVVTVSNPGSGNRYYLDGVLQATISATPGNTYKFDQADGTNSGHPLRLSITSNGTHSGGSAYTTGVTTNGTPGSAGAYTQIEVTATTVQALYYYCTNHSGMGGSFNTGSSATVQYQDREGFNIQNFSADQTSVGQIYYNTSSGSFKAVTAGGVPIGTWSSGGTMNTARSDLSAAVFGPSSAGLGIGGYNPPGSPSARAITESYNGSSWTEVADLNTGRWIAAGFGTQTSAVNSCGCTVDSSQFTAEAETWNGSSWTAAPDVNTTRRSYGASGASSTSGLMFGGRNVPAYFAVTESWDGSSWTEVGDLNTARAYMAGNGTQTSAVTASGLAPSPTTVSETWNGSSWTEITELSTARHDASMFGSGNTDAIISGGSPNPKALTEYWDGSSWTEVADRASAMNAGAGSGASCTNGMTFGGLIGPPGNTGITEEFSAAAFQVKTLTTS